MLATLATSGAASLRCGLDLLGRICVFLPLSLRDRSCSVFLHPYLDRPTGRQAELVGADAAGFPQHPYRCDRGVAVADVFSLDETSDQEGEAGA